MLIKKMSMLAVAAAIAGSTVLGFPTAVFAENFNEIYVFGDSLSDTGNAFKTTQGESPPNPLYFRGRYSNGPVWVEYLASKLNVTYKPDNNFAFGGATTGNSRATPPGLLTQIESYRATHSSANPNALYILWAGANDYLGGATDSTAPISNLATAVQSLSAIGAKNIAVVNLPDLGELPGTRTSQRSELLNDLTKTHNAQLEMSVNNLQQQLGTDRKIIYLDINALFNQAKSEPEKLGFKNVTQPCLSQGSKCANPNEYLFWDDIHPTTAAHKWLVELSVSKLKSAAEPTSKSAANYALPLGALALGAVSAGLMLRRSKALKS